MKAPVNVGDVIDDRYRIERILGGGAMSVVTLAFHHELEQYVAIKFLHTLGADEDERLKRFRREARAAAKIRSEHVARVFDFGTLANGGPYLVMEHLRGNDLSDELMERGPLPVSEVAGYMLQTLEALAEAHAFGIIHRDLKPENLFLAERPDGTRSIKVLDFGISKAALEGALSGFSLTRTTSFMGSPLYMSPEQMRSSADVDSRSDIWALGTIMYEAVSGKLPFMADTMPELCRAVIEEEPEPLSKCSDGCPKEFSDIVQRCLEKERDARYTSVADLAQALTPFAPRVLSSADRTGRILTLSSAVTRGSALAEVLREPAREQTPRHEATAAPAPVDTINAAPSLRSRWRPVHAVAGGGAVAALLLWLTWAGQTEQPTTVQAAKGEVAPLSSPEPERSPKLSTAPLPTTRSGSAEQGQSIPFMGAGVGAPAQVTALPSTALPSTALPSTALPGTALPSTALPSTALPSTALPSTAPLSTAARLRPRARPRQVEPEPSAAPAVPAQSSSVPAARSPKTTNAWDPDSFGGRY